MTKQGTRVLVAHPSSELYGTDRVLLESVDGFLERGWTVSVALPVDGPLVPELQKRGVTVYRCSSPVLRKSLLSPTGLLRLAASTAMGTLRGIRLIAHVDPDVLYVNTITIPLWPLLARLTGRPALTHVHEAEGSAPKMLQMALAAPLLAATSIVTNSRYSADVHARAVRGLSGRAEIVYNGVPGPTVTTAARREAPVPLRVLYVGRLSHRKGVDVVIDAVGELHRRSFPIRLDIVGAVYPGYEPYESSLRESVTRQGLTSVVTFHGFHADVSEYRRSSDVAVVPSRLDEPFGNTAVETLLAGRPLVVSETSGLKEAAEGYGSAQFVPPGDPERLAEALQRVVEDWDRYREAAAADATAAALKHGTATYREAVSAALQRTACVAG
ncbi:glycosyltransferase family 4 protein [Arthrobacter agilis]|uniref:glycosyltransferase family 4 protein n=1 Tax=Arthrobacter agilis TaxID=37921 RepID=UPI0023656907|nr:glycosyltransferase family 4 protein [Arthrobacter agilis]WDF34274.1 glycosyltransferase family 4 protein [Arthrobacter agilis]